MTFATITPAGDTPQTDDTKTRLTLAISTRANITITATTENELSEYACLARAGSRRIESILVQIARQAERLHEQGRSGSAEDVLSDSGQVSRRQAKQEASRAKTAAELPALGEALANGEVSGDHLDAVTRAKNSLTKDQQAHLDVETLAKLAPVLGPDEFAEATKQAVEKARNDWGLGRSIEERQRSTFSHWRDRHTGMGRLSGWLDPERYDALKTQLATEVGSLAAARRNDPDHKGGNVSKDEHLAMDALVSLITNGTAAGAVQSGARPTLYLHVDWQTAIAGPHDGPTALRETDSGHHLPPESIQRALCDAVVQPLLVDGGRPIKVGRKYRTATDAQIAVLKALYDTCGWYGCTTEVAWCQMHHVKFWEQGGTTDVTNLIPLCSHHHHKVHDEHWGLHLAADRTLSIKKPNGDTWRVSRPERLKPNYMAAGYAPSRGEPGAASSRT
ncbi:MAG: DUF222 domain-containing protein [Acidimicrobiales bacterium]